MDALTIKEMIRDELDEFLGKLFKRKPKYDCNKVRAAYDQVRRGRLPLSDKDMYFLHKAEKYMKKHCPDLMEGIDEEESA